MVVARFFDHFLCFDGQVPTAIPVVMLIISVYLVVAPIAHNPRIEFLYATLFVLSGMIFYIPFIACKVRLTFLSKYLESCVGAVDDGNHHSAGMLTQVKPVKYTC